MSTLEFINKVFLQWFFIRLAKCQERTIDEVVMREVSLLSNGKYAYGGQIKKYHIEKWYSLTGWVIPLTGWRSDYAYLWRQWTLPITKRKITYK